MSRKKIIGIGILIITLLLGGAYIRYLQTNTLTLGMYVGSNWGVYENDGYQTLDAAIETFEEQTGIKVKYESGIRKEDYSMWLAEKMVSGKAPDVMIVLPDDFNYLASIGALVDVNDVLNEEEKENYYRTSLLAGNYEGVQYALPFESNPMLMCVNLDILEKEGIRIPDKWSVKDFYDICQKVTKDTNGDGVIDQFGCYNYTWENALDSYGLSVFNSLATICNINSDEHKEAIGYVQKLMNLNEGYQVSSKDFDAGKVAFRPMSMAEYRTYAPYPYRISKYADFNWHCIPMPSGNNTEYFTSCDTALIAVYTKSNNKEAAKKFIKLLSSDNTLQQRMFMDSSGVTVLKPILTSEASRSMLADEFEDGISVDTLDYIMEHTINEYKFKNKAAMSELADYLVTQALNSDELDSQLNQIKNELETKLKE